MAAPHPQGAHFHCGKIYREKLADGRRWNYDAGELEKATEAVVSGSMTPAAAARAFGIPQQTLYTRRAKMMKKTEKSDGGNSTNTDKT